MKTYTLFYGRFPAACKGYLNGITVKLPSGNCIIWIDSAKDEKTQEKALKHELAHLHFRHTEAEDYERNPDRYEREADEYAARMTGEELKHLLTFCTGRKTLAEADISAFDIEYAQAQAG